MFFDCVAAKRIQVIVPTLLHAETAGTISRVRKNSIEAMDFSRKLAALPFIRWISLDETLAGFVSKLAADHRLRGADAIYAAVALENGCKLVSLENEHLSRLTDVLDVLTLEQAFAGVISSSP